MTSYLKYKPGWMQLLVFGSITLGVFLVAVSAGMWIISRVFGVPLEQLTTGKLDTPAFLAAGRAAQALLSLSLFGIPALVFGYLSHERPCSFLGCKPPQPPSMWLASLLLFLVALPMVAWVSQLNHHLSLPPSLAGLEKSIREAEEKTSTSIKQMLQMRSTGEMLLMVGILAVIPAIVEELFFRSVLQRIFIYVTRRPWVGIILTAVLFSAIHGQFLGFFPRLFLGVLLGAMYWYSGSIWPAILVHFLNNAVQVFAVYRNPALADKEWDIPFTLVAGSTLLTVFVLWWMHQRSHTHYAAQYDTDDEMSFDTKNKSHLN
jgi:membrane protease YdiL (CAAX protease family)